MQPGKLREAQILPGQGLGDTPSEVFREWGPGYVAWLGPCFSYQWVLSQSQEGSISNILSTPPSGQEVLSANQLPPDPMTCTQMVDRW